MHWPQTFVPDANDDLAGSSNDTTPTTSSSDLSLLLSPPSTPFMRPRRDSMPSTPGSSPVKRRGDALGLVLALDYQGDVDESMNTDSIVGDASEIDRSNTVSAPPLLEQPQRRVPKLRPLHEAWEDDTLDELINIPPLPLTTSSYAPPELPKSLPHLGFLEGDPMYPLLPAPWPPTREPLHIPAIPPRPQLVFRESRLVETFYALPPGLKSTLEVHVQCDHCDSLIAPHKLEGHMWIHCGFPHIAGEKAKILSFLRTPTGA